MHLQDVYKRQGDNWDKEHIEPDSDEQLPLMKQRRSRVAYYNNECSSGWLRNAMKKEFSSASFAVVDTLSLIHICNSCICNYLSGNS